MIETELPCMPEKPESQKIAESILEAKDDIAQINDRLRVYLEALSAAMRKEDRVYIFVAGFSFELRDIEKIIIKPLKCEISNIRISPGILPKE
jgi:hypothetical protein